MSLGGILLFLCTKLHYPVHKLSCSLVKAFELETIGHVAKLHHIPDLLTWQWELVRGACRNLKVQKALQMIQIEVVYRQAFGNQWYRGRNNVTFPFSCNLCEPFSLNVQLLCSAITITTCMLLNVCPINFIIGCI